MILAIRRMGEKPDSNYGLIPVWVDVLYKSTRLTTSGVPSAIVLPHPKSSLFRATVKYPRVQV